ncbi:uncharacterized protein LOC113465577 [Diaphorina citri]|uniref:Uncharacterized protein LOC113465577 n=1 Tax=Diaphorina citri TaxID=121845 RepID=A0A3Q0IMY1_DIACI|nr:uncharacterized protein LOC113465577 [Diaphorina citri]
METVFSPQALPLVICTNIGLSMCLYQLTRYNTLPKVRIYKFSLEALTIVLQFFFLNNCSEIMDDCNAMVCRSINSSHWQHCTRDTKRGLMSLLRICQRPNHLKFYGGRSHHSASGPVLECRQNSVQLRQLYANEQ